MIDYTVVVVLIHIIILSMITSVLGVLVLLGGQSLLSDTIAHACLPGIVMAFLITKSRNPGILLGGAIASSTFGTLCIHILERTTSLKKDTILGIILSVFFGAGLVLMTIAQRSTMYPKIQFHKILFGALATIMPLDTYILMATASFVMVLLVLFWKEFVIHIFDSCYTMSIGYPVHCIRTLLTYLMLVTVITGLQTVGIMLISSMLIAPAAAAYQWCTQINRLTILALCIGVSSSVSGALISYTANIPTGPTIVIMLNIFVVLSVLFGKERGIVWTYL